MKKLLSIFAAALITANMFAQSPQNITNLSDLINNQDAATKAYVKLKVSKTCDTLFLGSEQYVIIPGISAANTFTDSRDGNTYSYVTIGSQVWMAENLAYLPVVNQVADGSEDAPGSYYYVSGYDGTNVTDAKATSNYKNYGVLYNWTAAMCACPTGWHLPSDAEWTQLTDYLGGRSVAGGKLKETGTTHWTDPNIGATNETGFSARPGGARYTYTPSGSFYALNTMAYFQTSTEGGQDLKYAYRRGISNATVGVSRTLTDAFKESAFSVRCVKNYGIDQPVTAVPKQTYTSTISVYPTVTSDMIYFRDLPENSRIEIVDMFGRTIETKSASELSTGLSLQMMNNGLYIVRIIQEDKEVQSLKIIKK